MVEWHCPLEKSQHGVQGAVRKQPNVYDSTTVRIHLSLRIASQAHEQWHVHEMRERELGRDSVSEFVLVGRHEIPTTLLPTLPWQFASHTRRPLRLSSCVACQSTSANQHGSHIPYICTSRDKLPPLESTVKSGARSQIFVERVNRGKKRRLTSQYFFKHSDLRQLHAAATDPVSKAVLFFAIVSLIAFSRISRFDSVFKHSMHLQPSQYTLREKHSQ
jgi:hypothetical protein